jgi:hypothetical protein
MGDSSIASAEFRLEIRDLYRTVNAEAPQNDSNAWAQ